MEFADRAPRRWLIAGGLFLAVILLYLVARSFRRDRVEGHAYAIPTSHHRIIVEVLNGSNRPGLARLGARRLRRSGFDVVFFGNAEHPVGDTTRVLLRRGDGDQADRVRSALGVGQVHNALDSLRQVDVTVILGSDFVADEDGRP
ncbi:MAG TPA: LytR C-terminal domain-containing protein [Gemmatimonadales bacterium]|nr:LytR C-terminal domain-containing protein [Gemmatimonadales bacterium]